MWYAPGMDKNKLIESKGQLLTYFDFVKGANLDDIDTLYDNLSKILRNNENLQKIIATHDINFKNRINKKNLYIAEIQKHLEVLAKIYNINLDGLYDIDFFKFIIALHNYRADVNFLKYNSLFEYLMFLITDTTTSFIKDEDWELFIKQTKYNIDIKHTDFLNSANRFNIHLQKAVETLKNEYACYAYCINKNHILNVDGLTQTLFILPIKEIVTMLNTFIEDELKDEVFGIDKIEYFIKKYKLTTSEAEMFKYRAKNLEQSNKNIAIHFSISIAAVEKTTNKLMHNLKIELGANENKKFKTLMHRYLST